MKKFATFAGKAILAVAVFFTAVYLAYECRCLALGYEMANSARSACQESWSQLETNCRGQAALSFRLIAVSRIHAVGDEEKFAATVRASELVSNGDWRGAAESISIQQQYLEAVSDLEEKNLELLSMLVGIAEFKSSAECQSLAYEFGNKRLGVPCERAKFIEAVRQYNEILAEGGSRILSYFGFKELEYYRSRASRKL